MRRALARRDRAIEPERRQQQTALFGGQLRFDGDLAAPERLEIDPAHRGDDRPCRDRGRTPELRRIELENRARTGAIGLLGIPVEIER
jgi:hypothetical protein